jgi:hypothetical protein
MAAIRPARPGAMKGGAAANSFRRHSLWGARTVLPTLTWASRFRCPLVFVEEAAGDGSALDPLPERVGDGWPGRGGRNW